jgi:hypothetical protein
MKRRGRAMKIQVEGLDTESGTWSVTEKRARTNRDNFVSFFTVKGRFGYNRIRIFKTFSPKTVLLLARLYMAHDYELEEIFSYARRFKKAVDQMSSDDMEQVEQLLKIQEVME